jgi:hypothetical protein
MTNSYVYGIPKQGNFIVVFFIFIHFSKLVFYLYPNSFCRQVVSTLTTGKVAYKQVHILFLHIILSTKIIVTICHSITIYPPNENIILTPMYARQAFVELDIMILVFVANLARQAQQKDLSMGCACK